jgi:hypothetical protein
MRLPSEAQIKFADEISKVLNIDFPISSREFTAQQYYNFIANHINDYREVLNSDPSYEDDLEWCPPIDEWGSYYEY